MPFGALTLGLGLTRQGSGEPPEPAAPTINSNVIAPDEGEVGTVFDGAPSISGYPSPTPTYQWQNSADGSTGWANIGGATSRSYTSIAETFLRRLLTATNSEGSDGPDASNVVEVTAALPSSDPVLLAEGGDEILLTEGGDAILLSEAA